MQPLAIKVLHGHVLLTPDLIQCNYKKNRLLFEAQLQVHVASNYRGGSRIRERRSTANHSGENLKVKDIHELLISIRSKQESGYS